MSIGRRGFVGAIAAFAVAPFAWLTKPKPKPKVLPPSRVPPRQRNGSDILDPPWPEPGRPGHWLVPWHERIPGTDQWMPCYKSVTAEEARELQSKALTMYCDMRSHQDDPTWYGRLPT
jgi:hypothetical protein